MNKFLLFYCDFQKQTEILNDLKFEKNLEIHEVGLIRHTNIFLKILRRIHLNNKINFPFKYIWYNINKYKFNDFDEYYLLVVPEAFFIYDINTFKKLNKKKNIHLIMLTFDSIDAKTPICKKIKQYKEAIKWDYIYTYDLEESKKYGLEYMDEAYYSLPHIKEKGKESDIYYLGALKPGRIEKTFEFYQEFKNNDINSCFDIYRNNRKDENRYSNEINYYNDRKPYRCFIPNIKSTKCILEILQEGQKGQTLRYFEAVCFNKKLLTNNVNVKNLKYYNEKYMKVFDDINDIDYEWIKEDFEINYNYNNDFSPCNLLKKIKGKYNIE